MIPLVQSSQNGFSFLACPTFLHASLFLFLSRQVLTYVLHTHIGLAETFQSFTQLLEISVDRQLARFLVLSHVVVELANALLIYLPIIRVVSDESREAVLPLQSGDLLMECFDLLIDKLANTHGLLPVIDLEFLVLGGSISKQLLFIDLKEPPNFFDDFLLVLEQLVVYALPESHQVVVDLIVGPTELLEENDVLIAFLFGIKEDFLEVDVGRLVVLEEVLLGVFDDAVGAEGHEALRIAAEVGEHFVLVVGAVDPALLCVLGQRGGVDARHPLNQTIIITSALQLLIIINFMATKRKVRVKKLEGTSFLISQDEPVGKGSYGEVVRAYCTEQPSSQLVAKIINLQSIHNLASVQSELAALRELPPHENLVNCRKSQLSSSSNLYIIMEYCSGGSLQGFLHRAQLMPEHKIWDFLQQFCRGYQVLHDAHIIHRDIKPENILIHEGAYKIADFGVAKHMQNTSCMQNMSLKGTPLYIAPQLIQSKEGCSKVDIFSLGCVLYQLAYDGQHPFYSQTDKFKGLLDYFNSMKNKQVVLRQKNKKGELRSLQLRQLISKMLMKDHKDRISWEHIFAHEKVAINKLKEKKPARTANQRQQQLDLLRRSLIEVNRSSVKIEEFQEKDNPREKRESLAFELIQFEQLLGGKDMRLLERLLFRLKVTLLTILHCHSKISHIVKENAKTKKLKPQIIDSLKQVALQGLLFLLKYIQIALKRIATYQKPILKQLQHIMQQDRARVMEEYRKELKIFRNIEEDRAQQQLANYDLRSYQHSLYSLLTEYCEFQAEAKLHLRAVVALLVDIYDSSLKLGDLGQEKKVQWSRGEEVEELQTKMDQICLNRLQPQEFHQFLLNKEQVTEKQLNQSLQQVGLLFQ